MYHLFHDNDAEHMHSHPPNNYSHPDPFNNLDPVHMELFMNVLKMFFEKVWCSNTFCRTNENGQKMGANMVSLAPSIEALNEFRSFNTRNLQLCASIKVQTEICHNTHNMDLEFIRKSRVYFYQPHCLAASGEYSSKVFMRPPIDWPAPHHW